MIGAGVMPDVTLARAAGLELGERGGVRVRRAAGDRGARASSRRATSPSTTAWSTAGRLRIEHWDVAFNHGKTAALNMLGAGSPHDVVPYFFSDLADWASMEYVGPAREWDREVVRGSIDEGEFSVWYLHDGQVAAALSVGRSDDLEHARRLIDRAHRVGDRADALADLDTDLGRL